MLVQRWGLWRHPDFVKLWIGQTVSVFGSRITGGALEFTALLVLGATPFQMGLLRTVDSVPVLLFGLMAGVWVDRLRRRRVMIAADLSRAVLLVSIPAAALLGVLSTWQLFVVTGLTGVLTLFFDVAYQAYVPDLVQREHILEANSKMGLSSSLAEVTGQGIGGILVQLVTAPMAILFDSLSFLWSALLLWRIRTPERRLQQGDAHPDAWGEIVEGLLVVAGNPLLRAFVCTAATRGLFGNFYGALYSLYAIRVLGLGPALVGVTIAMGGAGGLLGALLAERLARRVGVGVTMLGAAVLEGATGLLIPLAGGPVLVATAMLMACQFVGDTCLTVYEINALSVRQAVIPDRLLGRVNASMHIVDGGVGPLGALVGGALGGFIGVRPTVWIAALGGLLGLLWLFFSPLAKLKELASVEEGDEPRRQVHASSGGGQ